MPRGKPKEWMEVVITETYKLRNGTNELVVDRAYADQFFAAMPNTENDGYKLNDFVVENNEGLAMVATFMNHILTPDFPSRVRIEVATMVVRSYMRL